MSLESHLAELERRHQALQREIEVAQTHPAVDDLEIANLKRRKLLLKDQIVRLKGENTLH